MMPAMPPLTTLGTSEKVSLAAAAGAATAAAVSAAASLPPTTSFVVAITSTEYVSQSNLTSVSL